MPYHFVADSFHEELFRAGGGVRGNIRWSF